MKHSSHEHELILNEIYIARDGDLCRGCSEQIFSYNSFVYSCSRITGAGTSTDASADNNSCASFLLHKNCAELPERIQNPANPKELLHLCVDYSFSKYLRFLELTSFNIECDICDRNISWSPKQFFYYRRNENRITFDGYVCLNCVMFRTQMSLEDRKFRHPSHYQHMVSLIQQPSSFKCHACNVDDNIKHMSYRCTRCQFWVHKSCAEAPRTFQFRFHDEHPLILSLSLPQVYRKFEQYCGLCNKKLSRLVWIYYCPKCRFFTHFQCARSFKGILDDGENENYDSEVEQLPAPDELSVTLLREKFIKAKSTQNNNASILSSGNEIQHWTHKEHPLQLINVNELKNKQDDELSLLCDGCIQSIRTDEGQIYGCVSCNFFMHKFCAELPKRIKVNIGRAGLYANANKHSEPYKLFYCRGCGEGCNGIFFKLGGFNFHIGCVTLPKMIKHEAHRHKLKRVLVREPKDCKACYKLILMKMF
nr:PREDICTED: uncharacterized protein LOC108202134 [Daucus carota subsp. sativus]